VELDVITAVWGIRSGQATHFAKTLARNFQSDLGQDGILPMVLLLIDQRWDLSNYLRETAIQSFLSGHHMCEVFAKSCSC